MAIQDLNEKFSIVDPRTGKPTMYFLRLLRDRGSETLGVNERLISVETDITTLTNSVASLEGTIFTAGTGLSGGGTLGVDDPIVINLNASLDDLNDVDITTTPPTDGQALVWNNGTGTWEPGDVASGGSGGPFGGVFLRYSSGTPSQNYVGGPFAIPFGSGTTVYDTDDAHDEVTDNTRITIPAGIVRAKFFGNVNLQFIDTGQFANLRLYRNGVLEPGLFQMQTTDGVQQNWMQFVTPSLEVVEGDYFELMLSIESDTSITLNAAFAAEWGSGGGASALNDLSDVDTATIPPTDGQALVWNNSTMEWEPGDVITAPDFNPAEEAAADSTYLYFGQQESGSDWYIRRVIRLSTTADIANMSNNGAYADLASAWPDRAILTYA